MENHIINQLFYIPANNFQAHLDVSNNNRIIFSGRFGCGKTTFLKHFFDTYKDKYESYRIAPVNYVISHNEDILQYIKYDILYELLQKPEVTVEENDISNVYLLGKDEVEAIFRVALSCLNYVGYDFEKIYDRLKDLKEILDKKKKAINEGDAFETFLRNIEIQKGSLFENDLITNLIEKVLIRNSSKTNKQNVLIIDDIDRLDPEHIFRILNIFSAHFDEELYKHKGKLNKFGFDKIILVFDYDNLKSLFAAKYGIDADFNGYIDKFYSHEVFYFNNRSILIKHISDLLSKMAEKDRYYLDVIRYFGRNEDVFEKIIIEAFSAGLSNLRDLKKVIGKNIDRDNSIESVFYGRSKVGVFFLIKLIYFLFGNTDNIIRILNELKRMNVNLKIDYYSFNIFYKVLSNVKNVTFTDHKATYDLKIDQTNIKFRIERKNGQEEVTSIEENIPPVGYTDISIDSSFLLLKYFFTTLKKNNHFN
jgi:hypothetical protein